MDTTNSNTGGIPEIKGPAKVICDYQTTLKIERATEDSKSQAAISSTEGAQTVLGYKRCTLSEYERSQDYYRHLDNYELLDMHLSINLIVDEVKKVVAWDDDLGKLIKEEAGKLNDLKAKLLDANNSACTMSNCLKGVLGLDHNRCNGKDSGSEPWKLEVKKLVNKITEQAGELSKQGQETAGAMIKIAGIHTFSDLRSLDPLLKKLPTAIKEFRAATDGNLKAAAEGEKKAQTDLAKAIEELNKAEFAGYDADSTYNGLHSAVTFICGGPCELLTRVEEICRETVPKSDEEDKPRNGLNNDYPDND